MNSMETIQPNAFAVVEYELTNEGGEVLDSSTGPEGEPIEYVHGYGMLVPGLEVALAGLRAGDAKGIVVSAAEGFGEYDDELVLEIDRAELPNPKHVEVGDEFVAESPDGEELPLRVLEVRADSVVVDGNHPLAGVTLHYTVKVQKVRQATPEEVEQAASDFDAASEHVHGEHCDHSHDDPVDVPLVALRPRPKKESLN
jgi:FKBP-type peptidyl-prolyl cis-trans isomerase SlyD